MIPRDLLDQVRRAMRPLYHQLANTVARAVVQLVNDATKLQLLQIGVQEGEDLDDAERFQEYGFSSVPKSGAEAVVVFPNGDHGHPLVVAVDDRRYRPTGKPPGHACIYHYTGAIVEFTDQGDVVVTPAAGRKVLLGSGSAGDPVALKSDLQDLLDALAAGIAGVASGDGGTAALTAIQTYLTTTLSPPFPRAAGKVEAE